MNQLDPNGPITIEPDYKGLAPAKKRRWVVGNDGYPIGEIYWLSGGYRFKTHGYTLSGDQLHKLSEFIRSENNRALHHTQD